MNTLQQYTPPTVEIVETRATKPIMTSQTMDVSTEKATIDEYDWEL